MKSKFTVEIQFEDRPLSSDLIEVMQLLGEMVAKNYAYPFNGEAVQSLGFGQDRQTIKWKISLADGEETGEVEDATQPGF